MSRSGYTDDCDLGLLNLWRGTVASSIRGKRGQAFLRELINALDAMPHKRLIARDLQTADGEVCAIGSVGAQRGIDMTKLDPEDYETIARTFGIAAPLVQEIEWWNDEGNFDRETGEQRWHRMRAWAESMLKKCEQA